MIAIESDPVLVDLHPQPRCVAAAQTLRDLNELRQAQLAIAGSLNDIRNRSRGVLNLAVGFRHGASRLRAHSGKPLAPAGSLQVKHASTRIKSTHACPGLTRTSGDAACRLEQIGVAALSPVRRASFNSDAARDLTPRPPRESILPRRGSRGPSASPSSRARRLAKDRGWSARFAVQAFRD